MTDLLWMIVFLQVAMGGFDTVYHHELTERLAWRPSQAAELKLHSVRNIAYAAMFALLGWSEPHGAAAVALVVLMGGELLITLWDFVEEDRTRRLPASERVNHTLLTLNYGVLLALLVPSPRSLGRIADRSCAGLPRRMELALQLRRNGCRRHGASRSRRRSPDGRDQIK